MPAGHEPADPMLGRVLADRYEIQHRLGEGAMGVVYRARHIKVGRPFAIKVLNARALGDPKLVQRFEREAAIAGRLRHPNVIGVVDVGEVDGARYLVMEFAEGPDLAELLGEAPMPLPRIIPLVRQLLDGLYHAHEHGLIHRDFKPENVIVERDAHGAEVPRIVDFGIALLLDDEPGDGHGRLTTNGLVLGTPHYMAPEQAVADPIDHRIDLFALGIVIYELLCGRLPFDGRGADIARANLLLDPPPIRERVPHLEVDPLLEAFSRRLMAKSRDDRPATAKLARELLDLIETDRPAAAGLLGVPLARIGRGPAVTESVVLDGATALDTQATLRLKKPPRAGAPRSGHDAAPVISPAALLAALPGPGMTVLSTPPPAPAGAPLPGAPRPAMLPPWPGATPSPSAGAMTPSATLTAVSPAGLASHSAAHTAVSSVASPRTPSTALTAVSPVGAQSAVITAVSPISGPPASAMITAVSPAGGPSPSTMVTVVTSVMSLPTPSTARTAVSPMLAMSPNAEHPASSSAESASSSAPQPPGGPSETPPSAAPAIMYVPQHAWADASARTSRRREGRDPEASRATSLGWQTSSLSIRRRRSWLIGGLVLAACGAAAITVAVTSSGDSDLSFHGHAAEAMRAAMAGRRDPAPAAPGGERSAAGDDGAAARASAAAGAVHETAAAGSAADAAHHAIDTGAHAVVADSARDDAAGSAAARGTFDSDTAPAAAASPDRNAAGAPADEGAAAGDAAQRDERAAHAAATERAERPRETVAQRSTATGRTATTERSATPERTTERRRRRDAGSDDARPASQSARMRSESLERTSPSPSPSTAGSRASSSLASASWTGPTERGEAGTTTTRSARPPAATAGESGAVPVGISPAALRQLYETTWSAIGQLDKTEGDDLTSQMLLVKIQEVMQSPAAARDRAADQLRRILQDARRRSAGRREP